MVNFNLKKLKAHLEKQFLPGMDWSNHGIHGWHIDHIIPVSAFNFSSPEEPSFKECWSLKNLRPLWAKDNLLKGKKIINDFQIPLPLSFL